MKKYPTLLFLLICSLNFYAQDQLLTYPSIPYNASEVLDDPSVIPKTESCGDISNYKIGHNKDFTVRVKKASDSSWIDLFEYNTFVNSGIGDISNVTRSSFVSFDYSGTVNVEITCNKFTSIAGKVLIRPLSRNIVQSISGNILTLTLTTPTQNNSNEKSYSDKLSIELNGNRYRNLQIFANRIHNYTTPSGPSTIIYDKVNNGTSLNIYNKSSYDAISKKYL